MDLVFSDLTEQGEHIVWDEDELAALESMVLAPGETVTVTGTVYVDLTHRDTVLVTATGEISGDPVSDTDPTTFVTPDKPAPEEPTEDPSEDPTEDPSDDPTDEPSESPSDGPTEDPTADPGEPTTPSNPSTPGLAVTGAEGTVAMTALALLTSGLGALLIVQARRRNAGAEL